MQMKLAEQKAARVEGFLNLREGRLLFALARAARGRGAIVEIGSHRGKSTVWIACGSLSGRAAPVYAVDPWERTGPDGRRHQEVFLENIRAAGVEKLVTPIAMRSEQAIASFDQPIEFLFIDGDHSYEGVRLDLELWYPKVVMGGIVAFHDSVQFPGVAQLMREAVFGSARFANARCSHSITLARKVEHANPIGALRSRLGAWSFERKHARLRRRQALGHRLHKP